MNLIQHFIPFTLFLFYATFGFSQDTIRFSLDVDNAVPNIGDTVIVDLLAEQFDGINVFQMDFLPSPTHLRYLGFQDAIDPSLAVVSNQTLVRVLLDGLFTGTIFSFPENSILVRLKFEVMDTSPSSLDAAYVGLIDDGGQTMAFIVHPVYLNDTTLPVSISEITTQQQDRCTSLQWQVEQQENIQEYQIQRSTDGIKYAEIGAVRPLDNELGTADYSFEDCAVVCQTRYYYRLKVLEQDGTFTYSDLVVSKSPCGKEEFVFQNPVGDFLDIRFSSTTSAPRRLAIFDVGGRVLIEKEVKGLSKQINVQLLPSGCYYLSIDGTTKKILKR